MGHRSTRSSPDRNPTTNCAACPSTAKCHPGADCDLAIVEVEEPLVAEAIHKNSGHGHCEDSEVFMCSQEMEIVNGLNYFSSFLLLVAMAST